MNEDDRQLLQSTYKLAEENNEILRRMQRVARWARAWRILYWVAIIALSFGAYYLIQPYVDAMKATISDLQGGTESSQNPSGFLQRFLD